MRWWKVGFGMILALTLSLSAGCSDGITRGKGEAGYYGMESYRQEARGQNFSGTTPNSSLLQALKEDCAKRGIRLTHETCAQGLDGNISYSYFINGDARHYIAVQVFPTEKDRVREISETYGKVGTAAGPESGEASLIAARGKIALVYTSSGRKQGQYSKVMKTVFDGLVK